VVALAAGWNVNCPRYLDEVSTAGSKRKDCLRDRCNPVTDRRGLHVSMDNGNDRFAGGSASDTAVTPQSRPRPYIRVRASVTGFSGPEMRGYPSTGGFAHS